MRILQTLPATLLLFCGASALAADLHDPDPIAIPDKTSPGDVVKSIENGMLLARWSMDKEEPGRITASFSPGGHVARVTIAYDDKLVRIAYLDSTALSYEEHDGHREIHRNYNKWVEKLGQEIARFDASGDPAAALKAPGQPSGINPPPSEKLSAFGHFEVARLTMLAPYAGQGANEEAAAKIQEQLDAMLGALVARWNNAAPADNHRTLKIEPHILSIKFINGGARFMVGAMAGSSFVEMRVTYTDAETGKVIADPRFYLRPGASRSFMGIADNKMLTEIAELVRNYTSANYDEAVGGAVGDVN